MRSIQPEMAARCLRVMFGANVREEARSGDLVVCLGAGDITSWAYALPGERRRLAANHFWARSIQSDSPCRFCSRSAA